MATLWDLWGEAGQPAPFPTADTHLKIGLFPGSPEGGGGGSARLPYRGLLFPSVSLAPPLALFRRPVASWQQ